MAALRHHPGITGATDGGLVGVAACLCGLVEGDAEGVGVHEAKVDALGVAGVQDRLGLARDAHGDGVEERLGGDGAAELLHACKV